MLDSLVHHENDYRLTQPLFAVRRILNGALKDLGVSPEINRRAIENYDYWRVEVEAIECEYQRKVENYEASRNARSPEKEVHCQNPTNIATPTGLSKKTRKYLAGH